VNTLPFLSFLRQLRCQRKAWLNDVSTLWKVQWCAQIWNRWRKKIVWATGLTQVNSHVCVKPMQFYSTMIVQSFWMTLLPVPSYSNLHPCYTMTYQNIRTPLPDCSSLTLRQNVGRDMWNLFWWCRVKFWWSCCIFTLRLFYFRDYRDVANNIKSTAGRKLLISIKETCDIWWLV